MHSAFWVQSAEPPGGPLLMPGFPAPSQKGTDASVKGRVGSSKLE